jgi:hypothetical protein
MRKFKPAPKQASANRIRERYLHQLGLQRGAASASSHQHWDDNNNNHVVVISGLPSLPEDRATNDNVLESHDFSHADGSYVSCCHDEGSCSNGGCGGGGGGKPSAIAIGPPQHLLSGVANENITSMALACPHPFLKNNHGSSHVNNTTNNTALPFSLSWGTSQLSRSAAVLLDEAGARNNDHDSVSSAATATTAESSFTAPMVSRYWGSAAAHTAGGTNNNIVTIPHPPSGTASVSSMGDSVTSAPGVFFQGRHCGGGGGNHRFTPPSSYTSTGGHCTSSLASALNRFNIDSDCEASVASNSIIDDPTMMMDDCNMDDSASFASHMSGGSSSIASTTKGSSSQRLTKKKKKIGKNQRLLDRASAHERMMQIRNDRSQKLRANMVHSQRMNHCSLVGLPMPHQLGGTTSAAAAPPASPARSRSSSISQASSIPLMHVDHQATPTNTTPVVVAAMMSNSCDPNDTATPMVFPVLPKHPSFGGGGDLGRTPTASNCSQHSKTTLPSGVHSKFFLQGTNCGPLTYHPQLASRIPTPPPPRLTVTASSSSSSSSLPSWSNTSSRDDLLAVSQSNSSQISDVEMNLANVVSSMQHSKQHRNVPSPPPTVKRAESIEDDVMEVAVTLSMLGGGRTTPINGGGGMIPRVR